MLRALFLGLSLGFLSPTLGLNLINKCSISSFGSFFFFVLVLSTAGTHGPEARVGLQGSFTALAFATPEHCPEASDSGFASAFAATVPARPGFARRCEPKAPNLAPPLFTCLAEWPGVWLA